MYIAQQTFTTTNGKTYRMGDVLSQSEYDALTTKEKSKVKQKEESNSTWVDEIWDHI